MKSEQHRREILQEANRQQETEAFLRLLAQRLEQEHAVSTQWIEAALRSALLEDGRGLPFWSSLDRLLASPFRSTSELMNQPLAR